MRALDDRRTAIRLIGLAAAVGLALRLLFSTAYWIDKPLTHDELEYLALARSLASGQGFAYPPAEAEEIEAERFSRAPAYPFLVSLVGGPAILNASPTSAPVSIKVAQSLIGAAVIPILATIAWRAAGPLAGVVTAFVAAIDPPLVWMCAFVLSEALYSLLAWLSVLLFGMAVDRQSPAARPRALAFVAAAGVAGGIAALTRPAIVVFLGLAAAWLFLKRPRALALAFLLGAAAVITPWTAHNVREHGRFILIAAEGGITFWTGNHPLATGDGDMAANPQIKNANLAFRQQHAGLSAEALEPFYYRDALAYIGEHPVRWMGLLARKAFYLVVPIGPSLASHSRRYQAASLLSYVLLLPFALSGARTLRRMRAPTPALWLIFTSAIITGLVFFPQERFRISEIDPTLVVCAAVWAAGWRARRHESGEPR